MNCSINKTGSSSHEFRGLSFADIFIHHINYSKIYVSLFCEFFGLFTHC